MAVGPLQQRAAFHHRDRLGGRLRRLFGSVFVVLVVLLASGLWLRRGETLNMAQTRAENLTDILGDHLNRTVSAIDTALTQLAMHGEGIGGTAAAATAWQPVLVAALGGLPGVGSLSVVDDKGIITHSTAPTIVGQSRAERYIFRQLSSGAATGLIVDQPFVGLPSGRLVIPMARRLTASDGRFAGMVVATFDPERLRDFYRAIDVGADGMTWVLHPAGAMMIREPPPAGPVGQLMPGNPLLAQAKDGPASGFIHAPLEPGGPRYLSAYHRISYPPLVVAVSLAEHDVLAAWRREAAIAAGIIGSVGLLLAFALLGIHREVRARGEAEGQMSVQAAALSAALVERDRADAALRASEAQFHAIMDHTPVLVLVKDLSGRYTFANRAAEQWVGAASTPAIGKTAHDIMLPELADQAQGADRQVIATKSPVQREWSLQTRAGRRTMLSVKFPLMNDAGEVEAVGTIATDMTDRKHAEQQLAHARRMEAIGQLTGGVAHDFNNMLTAILLNADVLVAQLQNDNLRPLAEAMRLAAERGAELTGRLLAFGRRQTLAPQPTDVNELLAGMEPLMHRTLGEHIEVKLLSGSGVWLATIDPGQLENAVLNLAVNARDAMPQGGRLTIRTANVELDADDAAHDPEAKAGQYVMIAVTDTGGGMTADVLARAFEPFFTTKDVGKGTGLGLSMVYGFVKQSGGHVRIYSEPGIGTAVKLYLPRSQELGAIAPAPAAAPVQLATGNEAILLVEDDRLVRAHTENQLRALGYHVVAAENAQAAIDAVERGLVPDLLFTDMVMPGRINGHELALKLRRRWPNLKVLYTSGYAHGAFDATSASDPMLGRHMLAKPYRRRDLAAKVREVLDEVAAAVS